MSAAARSMPATNDDLSRACEALHAIPPGISRPEWIEVMLGAIAAGVPDDEIVALNVPTARPLVYELDSELTPIRHYYLGDAAEIARAIQAVAAQGKARVG